MDQQPATKQDISDLRQEMRETETRIIDALTEKMRNIETALLTAFHSYATGQNARVGSLEAGNSALLTRIAALEDRVLNLETRRH